MILSHEHQFLFIKTHKTGGTSVELALASICGERDVITELTPEDEELRRSLGVRGPQNAEPAGGPRFHSHSPARRIRAALGEQAWSRCFKFCFERNPWDKVVSSYFWEHKSEPRPTISEFIRSGRAKLASSFELYSIEGVVAVDRVCRYEDLEGELERVRQHLRLPPLPALPRAKSRFRADRRHYREILGPADREAIAQLFAREIAHFGFRFEEADGHASRAGS